MDAGALRCVVGWLEVGAKTLAVLSLTSLVMLLAV
jgi:hypothetical protein